MQDFNNIPETALSSSVTSFRGSSTMDRLRIASLAFLLLAVSAAPSVKKIELHDIEQDNLKSEKANISNNFISPTKQPLTTDANLQELELLKRANNRPPFARPTEPLQPQPQQPRYIHQYAVDEPSEKQSAINFNNIPHLDTAQQAMLGYLSETPMHIYLIPHSFGKQTEQTINDSSAAAVDASAPGITQMTGNYVEVPTYLVPSGQGYMSQYTPRVTYVTHNHQLAANQLVAGAAASTGLSNPSELFYQVPPPPFSYRMFQNYPANKQIELNNAVNKHPELNQIEYLTPNKYPSESEYPSENEMKAPPQDYDEQTEVHDIKPFNSRIQQYNEHVTHVPIRENYNSGAIVELPSPNQLLFKSSQYPVPKALPDVRPKYVYGKTKYSPDPEPKHMRPFDIARNRFNSLVDSYVPSKAVYDYINKGYAKDPMSAYEALSSSKHLSGYNRFASTPRAYERGFRPNQMYQTAAGGITYGQLHMTPKQQNFARN